MTLVPLPDISLDDARRCLLEVYGESDATLHRLPGDVDVNFRVDAGTGSRSVLKFVAPRTPAAVLDMQAAALAHLARRMPEGAVPRMVPTSDGAPIGEFDGLRVRRIGWVAGPLLADAKPGMTGHSVRRHSPIYRDLGRFLAELDLALEGFSHPATGRPHPWDPMRLDMLGPRIEAVANPQRRAILDRVLAEWHRTVLPVRERLPRAVIHADGHDLNVIVDHVAHPRKVVGIFDFGDMVETARVCEPAVAAAYAAMQSTDPLDGIAAVVAGYHGGIPLTPDELGCVIPLVRARLVISVTVSAERRGTRDDPYASISEEGAWRVLQSLDAVHPRWGTARLRHACGLDPVEGAAATVRWLQEHRAEMTPPIDGCAVDSVASVDLSVGSPLLAGDPRDPESHRLAERISAEVERRGATVGIGRWNEARCLLLGPGFAPSGADDTDEHRTVHTGVDLFAPSGTEVRAPLAGRVVATSGRGSRSRWGVGVLLRHEAEAGVSFHSFWSHLESEASVRLSEGDRLAAGDPIGRIAPVPEVGYWPTHLHVQLVLDDFGAGVAIDGVAPARLREVAAALHPNPAPLLGLPGALVDAAEPGLDELVARRRSTMGANLTLSYDEPIAAVRGWRHHLWDLEGRCWLDLYNNVPHVGHAHPRVAEAIARQSALFAANTRYPSPVRQEYLERLLARFPDELDTVFLLPSASEANEVALRLARAFTDRRELVVQRAAYHGHTTGLIDVSPYKAEGPGGEGLPPHVEVVGIPDPYRGVHRSEHPEGERHLDAAVGAAYAADAAAEIAQMVDGGRPPGAFLAETMPSVGGQILTPTGYFAGMKSAIHEAGGLLIMDEVQTGFGRLGDWFWGFEQQEVVPDVVVLGKPMGNGYPIGAVVTRREIADAFANGMEFFSTYGGNPVACAAGLAVLGVLEDEGLPANASRQGRRLLEGLRDTAADHPSVGEVRGLGLFLGVEMVRDREGREPFPEGARYLVRRLRESGILAGTDGPDHNVIKLRGPLTVDSSAVNRVLEVWRRLLTEPGSLPEAW